MVIYIYIVYIMYFYFYYIVNRLFVNMLSFTSVRDKPYSVLRYSNTPLFDKRLLFVRLGHFFVVDIFSINFLIESA
jgi:hypothetical protein